MTETEIIERAETLPDRFASRIPAQTLESLRLMEAGGEYGERRAGCGIRESEPR